MDALSIAFARHGQVGELRDEVRIGERRVRLASIWYFSSEVLVDRLAGDPGERPPGCVLLGRIDVLRDADAPATLDGLRRLDRRRPARGATPVLSATIEFSGLKTGPAMVDQKIICAILPVEKPSTFSGKPYVVDVLRRVGQQVDEHLQRTDRLGS